MDDSFFAENTLVELNIPEDSNLDIETALSGPEIDSDDTLNSLVPSISQRKLLYFDELLPVYVVIRVPREDEAALRARIPRLAVSIDAQVLNDPSAPPIPPEKEGAPQQDVVWTGKLDPTEEPTVVMEESAEEEDVSTALLIWKMTVLLNRPRIRLTLPTISWRITATLGPSFQTDDAQESRYLPSGKPLPLNLLGSFSDALSLDGKAPYLSSDRLAKHGKPDTKATKKSIALKTLPKKALRALPSLTSRIRYHRSHKLGDLPTIAASLELDVPSSANHEVELLSVKLDLARGQVDMMAPEYSIKLPRTCHARDGLVWLYTLSPQHAFDDPINNSLSVHLLEVTIEAKVNVSKTCQPMTKIKWRTNVDFSTASHTVRKTLKPTMGSQPPLRPNVQASPGGNSLQSPYTHPDADIGPDNPQFTVTFIPPRTPIYIGETFQWEVIVVNKTGHVAQLVLTVLHKRRPQHGGKRHSHQSSTGSVTAVSKSGAIAEPVIDENLLYAAVKSGGPETAQLVCLSADVKVGPLAPGTAGWTELEFLPLTKGWLQLEAVRVTDTATGEYCDIRHMPDIVALERDSGEEATGSSSDRDGSG